MTTASQASTRDVASKPAWRGLLDLLLRVPQGRTHMAPADLPVTELTTPELLAFRLGQDRGEPLSPSVKTGDEVQAGLPLAKCGERRLRPSPVTGTVQGIRRRPDVHGGKAGTAVLIKPDEDSSADAFDALDPGAAERATLLERLRDAGLRTAAERPQGLADLLGGGEHRALIVLAADREPGLCGTARLLKDHLEDAVLATAMLGRAADAAKVLLAVPERQLTRVRQACQGHNLQVLGLPAVYPETLEIRVAARAGASGAPVLALETALAALAAVRDGRLQEHKLLTVIDSDGTPLKNLRVSMGAPIGEVLKAAGLEPAELDKVIAGGPLRGSAQISLDAAVDEGVDALMLQRAGSVPAWSDEPCINCGGCIDVCPENLQVQLLGRYSEFGLFERTPELSIERCLECGLCATVCVARRPLLQFIQLAKQQLAIEAGAVETATDTAEQVDAPAAGAETGGAA